MANDADENGDEERGRGADASSEGSPAEAGAAPKRVVLDPDLRIGRLDALYQRLSEALESAGAVELDMHAVDAVDTAGLQLILAFVRECRRQGKAVSWTQLEPPVAEAADILGMLGKLGLGTVAVAKGEACPST